MKEISLHILDIVQNSIHANANQIAIDITENTKLNILIIQVTDNGKGMSKELLDKVTDPFFTTGSKKTGLGIPLLQQHTEATGGSVKIESEQGKGTRITATFIHDHLDRQPLGDVTATLISLIRSYSDIDFIYNHSFNDRKFRFDTREIKKELDNIQINHPKIIAFIRDLFEKNSAQLVL
jgi:hypothetical protein